MSYGQRTLSSPYTYLHMYIEYGLNGSFHVVGYGFLEIRGLDRVHPALQTDNYFQG